MSKKISLENDFRQSVTENNLLATGEKILIAVSGGPDSVALTLLMESIKNEGGIKLAVFHLDHQIRKDSFKDMEFVRDLCNQYAIDFYSEKRDVQAYAKKSKRSIQDAARKIRYDLLETTAKRINADKIATAHQANDQIETFFLRLLRGASLTGLQSIPLRRNNIVRPILEFSKERILEYLNSKGQRYLTDPSNIKPVYFRNRVRNELLPVLEELNPAYLSVLSKNISLINEEEKFIKKLAADTCSKLLKKQNRIVDIDLQDFSNLERTLKRRVLREAIFSIKGDLLRIEYKHIETVLKNYKQFGFTLELPGNVLIYRDYKSLKLGPEDAFKPQKVRKSIVGVCKKISLKPDTSYFESSLVKKCKSSSLAVCLDYDKIKPPLVIRSRKAGDRFKPLGAKGTKKLQDFMVDKKIPKFSRDSIILVEDREKILWVAGYEIDERAKIENGTKKMLQLRIR